MAFWEKFFNLNEVELGGIESVGSPNTALSGSGLNGEVLDLSPTYGTTTRALSFKQTDLPALASEDLLLAFVKKLRNQSQLRGQLNRMANQLAQGFRVKGSADVATWSRRAEMYATVQRIFFELLSVGWCVVYCNEDKKGMPTLKVLHNVAVKRGIDGVPHVWLQLDDTVKSAIVANPKPFPKYWTPMLYASEGIDITRVYDTKGLKLKQGGAYFISLPTEPEDVYPVPPLYTLAKHALASEKLLMDVDAMGDTLASVLTHITVGNKDGQDMRNGKPKQVEKDRVTKLAEAFTIAKTKRTIITPADVEIKTVLPASNPFSTNLDTSQRLSGLVQEAIGLPDFQNVPSEGAAVFLAKSLYPSIEFLRSIVDQGFLSQLLLDIADRVPGADSARVIWSMDSIIPYSEKLNIAKFRWNTGGMSLQAINEYFDPDYDVDAAMTQKKLEQKYADVVPLLWEPSQGLSDVAMSNETKKAAEAPAPVIADPNAPVKPGAPVPPTTPKPVVSPKAPGTSVNPGAGRPKEKQV